MRFLTYFAAYFAPKDRAVSAIIQNSIQSYSGTCPCPYNNDAIGNSCGRRSAWARTGGRSPICYARDVPLDLLNDVRLGILRDYIQ
ncbi:MAG: hypothetical protein HN578_14820 [Rhodospirillales bacterium]|nr:hypothetical protein [Rhodospirillales bacterium]